MFCGVYLITTESDDKETAYDSEEDALLIHGRQSHDGFPTQIPISKQVHSGNSSPIMITSCSSNFDFSMMIPSRAMSISQSLPNPGLFSVISSFSEDRKSENTLQRISAVLSTVGSIRRLEIEHLNSHLARSPHFHK
jgi:hypothetical protein